MRLYRRAVVSSLFSFASILAVGAQTEPWSVEDVIRPSDVVVLGRVTATDPEAVVLAHRVFTRHTFLVEAYYKGSGASEISILTAGGTRTRIIDGERRQTISQVAGAPGARVGDEFLAFLAEVDKRSLSDPALQRSDTPFYIFYMWDGAKYRVQSNPDTGYRVVGLRLRTKVYLQGEAALRDFEKKENLPQFASVKDSGVLPRTVFVEDAVPVDELATRLQEVARGERPGNRRN